MLRALTFGQCLIETPVARIAPDSEIHFALLLSIVSAPADGASRDEVVARLWPRAAGEDGRHCLRQAMYRLRQLAVPVQLNAGRILLHGERAALDVHQLLHGTPTQGELVRLGAIPFLPGYEPSLGEPFTRWLEGLRERVALRLCRALADEVASARSRGRFHDMGRVARALLVLDPLNELATMVLAESLALQGSKVEALRLLEEYEVEVGAVNGTLQLPARMLRRRVAEVLDDGLQLRQFEVPFVGREHEFGALRALWRDVRAGCARTVIVSGEAGIGKSRLAAELVRLAVLDGGTVARYTTSAGDTFTPISTLVTLGQQLLTLPGALGCAAEQLAYIRRLGTPESISAWSVSGMAADVLYAQLVHAFSELVSAIAEEAPLVISVDDAERLHPTTWRVLVDVWDRVGRRGVLFLLAARRLPPWFGSLGARSCERLTQHLPIAPLSHAESQAFVRAWSEHNRVAVPDEMATRLATVSKGNPFYLTELAAHVGHGGDPERTPATILDLIGAQYRVLSKGAHRVLLAISVLESRATTGRVTQVLEQPAAEFMTALDELEEGGLVTSQGPDVRVRHRLIGEVALSLTMPSVVSFAHGRAAAVLEGEADATLSVELLGDCVTHWERAGETRRAYEAAMKLGYRLVGMGMGEEAEQAFVRAERLCTGPRERARSIEGRIVSTFLAGRWSDVGVLASAREDVLANLLQKEFGFDEMELLTAEARLFSTESAPIPERLLELVQSEVLSRRARLRAAVLLAILADNLFDEQLLSHALKASSDLLADTDSDAAVLQLIFHSTLGDRECAKHFLSLVERSSLISTDYTARLFGLRRCAEASLRVGDTRAAARFSSDALQLSEQLKLPHQIAESTVLLIRTHLARDEVEDAHLRANLLRRMQQKQQKAFARHTLLADAMVAWFAQDEILMRHARSSIPAISRSSIPRAEQTYLTIKQAGSIICGDRITNDQDLARLGELHRLGGRFGGQDFSSSVLFSSLRILGRTRQLRTMRARYLHGSRREQYDVPSALESLSE